jgi:hypothetical protein
VRNATIGFNELGAVTRRSPKSLIRCHQQPTNAVIHAVMSEERKTRHVIAMRQAKHTDVWGALRTIQIP